MTSGGIIKIEVDKEHVEPREFKATISCTFTKVFVATTMDEVLSEARGQPVVDWAQKWSDITIEPVEGKASLTEWVNRRLDKPIEDVNVEIKNRD